MNEDYAGLNLVELLDLLEPIPEPQPVSMLPQTQGWLWLGLILLVFLVWTGRLLLIRWRSNAYRREALREIASAKGDPVKIAEILRRTALMAYPRSQVAGLYGEDWLAFLNRTGAGFDQAGQVLAAAPYRPAAASADLEPAAARWIRTHKRRPERVR